MVASRSARTRKASAEAGPLATVRIDLASDESFAYRIDCTTCRAAGGRSQWSTYRRGEDNGYLAAMDRWTFHLVEKHPDEQAPCLAYLADAQQRLQERRDAREA